MDTLCPENGFYIPYQTGKIKTKHNYWTFREEVGQRLFGQWPFEQTSFRKGASLIQTHIFLHWRQNPHAKLQNQTNKLLTKVQVNLSKTVVVFKKSYTKITTWFLRWHKFTQAYTSTLFCGDKHKHKPLIVKRTRTNTRACPLKKTITITDSCPAMPCNWTLPSLLPEPPLFSLLHLHPATTLNLIFNIWFDIYHLILIFNI